MLYIFSGLPGTGKTTLAKAIAPHLNAMHLRIDTIEQQLYDSGIQDVGPIGYEVAYALAKDNLSLGLHVIADSVNPIALSRMAWQNVAIQVETDFINIEFICSDRMEHRERVESRSSDIPNLQLPSWEQVQNREYMPWREPRIIIDTAGRSPVQATHELLHHLRSHSKNS